jgi:hypothetical protein
MRAIQSRERPTLFSWRTRRDKQETANGLPAALYVWPADQLLQEASFAANLSLNAAPVALQTAGIACYCPAEDPSKPAIVLTHESAYCP